MALLAEQETILLINNADLEDGYVRFSTTYAPDFRALCKKVGKANLIDLQERRSPKGRVVEWLCKVPSSCLPESRLTFKSPGRMATFQG